MSIQIEQLNSIQKEAVESIDGPSLIIAGAGSGKTRTLTYRIANIIDRKKAKPSEILALTFTNKAAKEMRERTEKLLKGKSIAPLWIGTFHSVSARILRMESEHLGYSRSFTIYDVDDQVRAIKKIAGMLSIPQQEFSAKLIQSRLSRIKNRFISPKQLETIDTHDELDKLMPDIYRDYQKYLKNNNAMDFDDLLLNPIYLFDENETIRKKYASKFKYVLVDEYQDTNHAQYLLIQRLIKDHKNICVVGDEDQSIYGWRGANIENILNFNKDFSNAKVFKLEENYRSTSIIVEAANAVIKNNQSRLGKEVFSNKKSDEKIEVFKAETDQDEAKHIVDVIHTQMFSHKRSFNDIAILYRTNAQSRIIEDYLRRNTINYHIVGGIKFYERKEIKDLTSYLKVIVNPNDAIALKRIVNFPLRGVGETTVSKIEKFSEIDNVSLFEAMGRVDEIASISAAMSGRVVEFHKLISKFISLKDELSPVELTSALAEESGIMHHYKTEYDQYDSENRVANIEELLHSIEQFTEERKANKKKAALEEFLEEISLLTDIDRWNENNNYVTLMTLHSAKGLEFPVVYIAGVEMNTLPIARSLSNKNELEEERRLFYVGITRAQEKLYISYANSRKKYNRIENSEPSIFLDEVPGDTIHYISNQPPKTKARGKRGKARKKKLKSYFEDKQMDGENFRIGQPVYHPTFGKGKVLSLEGSGDKTKISVHFKEQDIIKKLIKKYANLSDLVE
jgi:DNA helicase-2/ATP-dependent DNA helicase PcrA